MVFKDVSHGLERGDADHWPDIALYPTHARAEDAYRLSQDYSSLKSLAECRGPHLARCAYPWMITAIEVKTESIESGFGFTPAGNRRRPSQTSNPPTARQQVGCIYQHVSQDILARRNESLEYF